MKFTSKPLFFLLAGIIFVYYGCKNALPKPGSATNISTTATMSPKDVASQVALNISQSLTGGLGAFDVTGGLGAPSAFAVRTNGLGAPIGMSRSISKFHSKERVLLNVANPDCSLVIDTTLNYTQSSGGITLSFLGSLKFTFMCANNVVSGFNTVDSLTISFTGADTSLNYKVGEHLTMTAVNPADSNSNAVLNGSLYSNATYQVKSGTSAGSGTLVFNYTLSAVNINPNTGIIGGNATFSTSASGPLGTWNYKGTIVFLGNSIAKITINGATYTVNLDTGVVS